MLPRRFAAAILLAASGGALADVVAVVSRQNPVSSLSRDQLSDIFLGRSQRFPDGRPAVSLDQPAASPAYADFYLLVSDKRPADIKAYWAKMIFTGRGQPPRVVAGDEQVKRTLSSSPNGIGYVDRQAVDDSVKTLTVE